MRGRGGQPATCSPIGYGVHALRSQYTTLYEFHALRSPCPTKSMHYPLAWTPAGWAWMQCDMFAAGGYGGGGSNSSSKCNVSAVCIGLCG